MNAKKYLMDPILTLAWIILNIFSWSLMDIFERFLIMFIFPEVGF